MIAFDPDKGLLVAPDGSARVVAFSDLAALEAAGMIERAPEQPDGAVRYCVTDRGVSYVDHLKAQP